MSGGFLGNLFSRVQGEAARIGNQAYDDTLGQIGGWFGDHVWGQHGSLADYTRGLNTMSVGGATGLGIPGMIGSQVEGYRQEGSNPGRSWGQFGAMQGESLLAMLGGWAASGAGGAGAAAGTAAGGGGAGIGAGAAGGGEAAAGTGALSAPGVGSGVEGGFWLGNSHYTADGTLLSTGGSGGSGGFLSSLFGNSGSGGSSSFLNANNISSLLKQFTSGQKQQTQQIQPSGDVQAAPVVLLNQKSTGQFSPDNPQTYNLSSPTGYLSYLNSIMNADDLQDYA